MSDIDTRYNTNNPPVAAPVTPQPGDLKTQIIGDRRIISQWDIAGTDGYGKPIYGWVAVDKSDVTSSGGSAGATWRDGEYGLEVDNLNLSRQKYAADVALEQAKAQALALQNAADNALAQGNLDLNRQLAAQQAANDQRVNQLTAQRNAIALKEAQMNARATVLGTQANLATTAADWAGNPRNSFAYLNLMNAQGTGAAAPGSATSATGGQYGGYRDELTSAYNDMFGNVGANINRALEDTYATPPEAAAPKEWYETTSAFTSASPDAQALFRSLPTTTQQQMVNMSPEQRAALSNYGRAPTPAPAIPDAQRQQMAAMTPEQKAAFEQYARGLTGAPAYAGGGKLTVNEPSGIFGLRSGQLRATLGEVGPEKLTVTPMQKPRSFADGGTVTVAPENTMHAYRGTAAENPWKAFDAKLRAGGAATLADMPSIPHGWTQANLDEVRATQAQLPEGGYPSLMKTVIPIRNIVKDAIAAGTINFGDKTLGRVQQLRDAGMTDYEIVDEYLFPRRNVMADGSLTRSPRWSNRVADIRFGAGSERATNIRSLNDYGVMPGETRKYLPGYLEAKAAGKVKSYTNQGHDLPGVKDYGKGQGPPAGGTTKTTSKSKKPPSQYEQAQERYGIGDPAAPTTPTTPPTTDDTTTPTTPAVDNSPQGILATALATALQGLGVNWSYVPGQGYAPPPSLITGAIWERIKNMPSLLALLQSAQSASGEDPTDWLAANARFQHAAPAYGSGGYSFR